MAVIEYVVSLAASILTRIFTSQRSSTNRIDHWNTILRHDSAGLSPNAGLDALLRVLQRIGIEVDRQLWCRAPALHATSKGHGPRGHDSGQAGIGVGVARTTISMLRTRPMPPLQASGPGRREAGRHDRTSRVLKACRKTAVSARRIALQMIHNTIASMACAINCAASPACSSSVRWPVAT